MCVRICVCMCVHGECVETRATANVWRSEENLWNQFSPSSFMWVAGTEPVLTSLYGEGFFPPSMSHFSDLIFRRILKPLCDLLTWKNGAAEFIY